MTGWINDVVSDQTIESAWGNLIRDRTITPFADAAERDSEIVSPDAGMTCWLENALCYATYNGTAWELTDQPSEAGPVLLGTYSAALPIRSYSRLVSGTTGSDAKINVALPDAPWTSVIAAHVSAVEDARIFVVQPTGDSTLSTIRVAAFSHAGGALISTAVLFTVTVIGQT